MELKEKYQLITIANLLYDTGIFDEQSENI